MLTSIVCKMIFYLLYFIIFNLTFSFDYTYDEKVITNLKNKSKKLVDDGNYQLALDIYNIILNIEKNIYSDNDMNLALTYDNISEIHLLLKNYDSALEYIKKSTPNKNSEQWINFIEWCKKCGLVKDGDNTLNTKVTPKKLQDNDMPPLPEQNKLSRKLGKQMESWINQ